ncbi:MAG: nicotinamide-nucleotide amidohydrolase family protein [Microcella sp.]|uniref:CinA family protein n=1 Tax=Microcella sp. TaxID=1913979 RepID=UPI0024C5FC55|nr:nicotinamide-nucleotide amidohydrolase family protein [Microcella sp.]UYN84534.1 MAG: nicotinamide-nucleotide amidohydrolase family protein [Microcella sp.]
MTESASPRAVEAIGLLARAGLTVALAESLTGGALCAELVSIPGASAVLRGAVVAYDTALKSSLLGVPAELLAEHGPVHAEVAGLMAEGVRAAAAVGGHPAAVGVATTGVAGPDPQGDAPVGLVFVAVADARGSAVREFCFDGDRAAVRSAAVAAALELLIDRLRECSG